MDDIAALLQSLQDPTAEERQQALARALSRQRAAGNLGLLTGDRVLGGFGQAQLAQAGQGEAGLMRAQDQATDNRRQSLQMALAAQAKAAAEKRQAEQDAASAREREIDNKRADKGQAVGMENAAATRALAAATFGLGQQRFAEDKAQHDKPKDLPSTTVMELADVPTAINQVGALMNSYKKYGMGTTSAKMSSMLPGAVGKAFGTDVSKFEADAKLAMQGVGKIMEGGKLAAGDEAKYQSILAEARNDPGLAEAKIAEAQAFLRSLVDNRIKALRAANYNVDALSGVIGGDTKPPAGASVEDALKAMGF